MIRLLTFYKEKLFLLCLSSLLLATVKGQHPAGSIFAEFTVGPSFPLGKFADKTYTDTSAGWVTTGWAANLSVGYSLSPSMGIFLAGGWQQNKQSEKPFEDAMRQKYGNDIETDINTESWKIGKILIGIYFEVPVSEKLFFQPRIAAGISKTAIPGFKQAASGIIDSIPWAVSFSRIKIPLSWTFTYQLSGALNYKLNNKIYLQAGMYHGDAKPVYKFTNFFTGATTERKYSLSSLHFLMGAGFRF